MTTGSLQTVLDFVEGRIRGKDFEQRLYTDLGLETLLKDGSLKWHDTYIKSNPYDFLIALHYDDPGAVLTAQGALERVLEGRGIAFKRTTAHSELYGLLLAAQPGWLSVDSAYLNDHVLPDAGGRTGKELKTWLAARLRELFRYAKRPPKWIQNPDWPINENGPMYFLGQIKLDAGVPFHDEAAVYVFFDPKTGVTKTVIQVY